MKKYDVMFCCCGRVHFMPMAWYDWMQEDCEHRRIIRVCQNCGATIMVFLDKNGNCFDVHETTITNAEITPSDMEYRLSFSRGEKIPLKCGYYADAHQADRYISWEYCREKLGTDYLPTAESMNPGCCEVDTERLIREIGDDDKLQSMSGYVVGIDWAGTKYDWRKKSPVGTGGMRMGVSAVVGRQKNRNKKKQA